MAVTISNTILAYLLALQDFSDSLSDVDKEGLKQVANQLKTQPKAWSSHIEPDLIQTIQGNSQLDKSYRSYKEKLDRLGEIPLDLLPKPGEVLATNSSGLIMKGISPDSEASGYEQQLNNVVIVINQSERPEEVVKQLDFLDRVKQFVNRDSK
ncbi:hypothetical protein [Chamaesiphon sp. VAR_48_metabat_135_sub]|uniref:hypothetical protein n=1 Tax=Chamaesiphon sp. VAR_48_metabat_135_sub TaxID=2964699 RepID=UPI00286C4EE5|nr:hypothetical protein [Chamaesiphon sp. VAR_48_metabat_135_sub]